MGAEDLIFAVNIAISGSTDYTAGDHGRFIRCQTGLHLSQDSMRFLHVGECQRKTQDNHGLNISPPFRQPQ